MNWSKSDWDFSLVYLFTDTIINFSVYFWDSSLMKKAVEQKIRHTYLKKNLLKTHKEKENNNPHNKIHHESFFDLFLRSCDLNLGTN